MLPITTADLLEAFRVAGHRAKGALTYIVLDCRALRSFQYARLPTAVHIGPDVGYAQAGGCLPRPAFQRRFLGVWSFPSHTPHRCDFHGQKRRVLRPKCLAQILCISNWKHRHVASVSRRRYRKFACSAIFPFFSPQFFAILHFGFFGVFFCRSCQLSGVFLTILQSAQLGNISPAVCCPTRRSSCTCGNASTALGAATSVSWGPGCTSVPPPPV